MTTGSKGVDCRNMVTARGPSTGSHPTVSVPGLARLVAFVFGRRQGWKALIEISVWFLWPHFEEGNKITDWPCPG